MSRRPHLQTSLSTEVTPWAQLVSTTDQVSDPVIIDKIKFVIGRSMKDCDLCLNGNKLVSSRHCFIEKDGDGVAWIKDTSSNGTLLNLTNKLSGAKCRLNHGDEIYVVYRKQDDGLNVAYLFQDLKTLESENEGDTTQEYSVDLDETLPNEDEFADIDGVSKASSSPLGLKRKAEESPAQLTTPKLQKPALKRLRTTPDEESKVPIVTEDHEEEKKDDQSSAGTEKSATAETQAVEADVCVTATTATSETLAVEVEKPAVDTSTAGPSTVEAQKDNSGAEKVESSEPKKDVPQPESKQTAQDEALEETLTCIICYEIMHDCVSLQPCLHSFCAGCFSGWMEMSLECPSCRMRAEHVKKNHMLNNLVEVYLSQHPDKKRPEEDIKQLEEKNKIKTNMFTPVAPGRDIAQEVDDADDYVGYESPEDVDSSESEGSPEGRDEGSCSDEGYTDSDEDDRGTAFNPFKRPVFGRIPPLFGAGIVTVPQTQCQQCPGAPQPNLTLGGVATAAENVVSKIIGFVKGDNPEKNVISIADPNAPTTSGGDAEPSTSGGATSADGAACSDDRLMDEVTLPTGEVKRCPRPPPHVCRPGQLHMLCQCCLQPMPDRRGDRATNNKIPPQQCTFCFRIFCHMYWGCRKADCSGCLAKFKDLTFDKKCLAGLILENPYESTIFTHYLEGKGIQVSDLLTDCCQKLEAGEFTCRDQGRHFSSESFICYTCGLRNFRELAYQYREAIPKEDLPPAVTNRPNCYWGRYCRTQKNKPHHALNFNHICDQTRNT